MNFSSRSKAWEFIKEKQAELREKQGAVGKIDEKAEVEKRGYSDDEKREMEALSDEIALIKREISQAHNWLEANMPDDKNPMMKKMSEREMRRGMSVMLNYLAGRRSFEDVPEQLRCMLDGRQLNVDMAVIDKVLDKRDAQNVDVLVPTIIGDIIDPLEKGIIFDKLGVKMQNNMTGNWVLPVLGAVEATIADKNAKLNDSSIPLDKLEPKFVRMGIKIPVNNEDMNDTGGKAWQIVTTQAPLGFSRLINRCVFSKTEVHANIPSLAYKITEKVTEAPSFENLTKLKGTVLKKGVIDDGTSAYIMNEVTKASLECTPRNVAGGDRMVIENNMLNGYPVLTTSELDDNVVIFGIFSYYLIGNKSGLRITVDPLTSADMDQTRFIINGTFAFEMLRKEAFGMVSAS